MGLFLRRVAANYVKMWQPFELFFLMKDRFRRFNWDEARTLFDPSVVSERVHLASLSLAKHCSLAGVVLNITSFSSVASWIHQERRVCLYFTCYRTENYERTRLAILPWSSNSCSLQLAWIAKLESDLRRNWRLQHLPLPLWHRQHLGWWQRNTPMMPAGGNWETTFRTRKTLQSKTENWVTKYPERRQNFQQ